MSTMAGEESKKEKESSPKATAVSTISEEKKTDGSDNDAGGASTASTSPTAAGTEKPSKNKNWLGKEVKRPRAEYQAEIDALKGKLAELEVDLENKTSELQQFKDWVSMAPSAF
jgi:hypothetical protein